MKDFVRPRWLFQLLRAIKAAEPSGNRPKVEWLPLLLSLFAVLPLAAQQASPNSKAMRDAATCPVEQLRVERLPDMNVPRSGHAAFWLNGELTVFGGHTSGFVPTPTAEYFRDGQWHLLPMPYSHDDGLVLPLSNGKVLLAGGHSEPLGIGQTFSVAFYDPASHTFDGFGCLDTKRALMGGVETDSGRVLISGNWYHDDDIECFDGNKSFSLVKEPAVPRTMPYLLHVAPDDVVIFSGQDTHGARYDSVVADRLKGDPFRIPLFDTWHPLSFDGPHNEDYFQTDDYTYLLPVCNDSGHIGIAKMRGTTFTLLPTAAPIPTTDGQDSIHYGLPVVDRQRQRYHLSGSNWKDRLYVLSVDYSREPAPIVLYRSATPLPPLSTVVPVLSPEGDIIVTGGIPSDNFHPHATAYRLVLQPEHPGSASAGFPWLTLLALLAVAVLLAYIIYKYKVPPSPPVEKAPLSPPEEKAPLSPPEGGTIDPALVPALETIEAPSGAVGGASLLQRIRQLMEQEHLYLNSELTIADLADRLGLHRNQLSDCINRQTGATFSQLVATYRVEHAKQLLRQQPDVKVSVVGSESGFANEKSFFRTFKAATGMTPTEWRAQQM